MTILRRLLAVIVPVWPHMLLAALFGFLTVGANIGLLTTSAYLIASAALQPPLAALALAITGVRFFGTSRAVFRYAERYLSHKATFHILYALRVWLYRRLEPLAPAGLARYQSGDLLSRIVADVDTLQFFYLRVIAPPAIALAVWAAMSYFLALFSSEMVWLLTAAFALGGVAAPWLLLRLGQGNSVELLAERSNLKALLVDAVSGMPELAAHHQKDMFLEKLDAVGGSLARRQQTAAWLAALSEALVSLLMNAALWGSLVVCIVLVATGKMDRLYLAVIPLAVQSCFEALQPLPMAFYVLQESLTAARRLFGVADTPPPVTDESGAAVDRWPENCAIICRNVSFAYDSTPTLTDISLALPAGSRTAIVGASGAGKTTLVSLLLRFAPYEGSITLGGRELTDYAADDVRRQFAVVSQDTHIFNASLGDNIRLARPDATEEDVVNAARRAALDEFIRALPDGYDTPAGLNGKALSGGQRQRLAIARAFLKDAPVLILDEPTAGLDAVTAEEIMDTVYRCSGGKSLIFITHRLAGLESMDQIIVLDKGRIAESGTMNELLATRGLFYSMWRLQQDIVE